MKQKMINKKRRNRFLVVLTAILLCAAPALATTQQTSLEETIENATSELMVKTALLENIGWDMLDVDVIAKDGHITLNGMAATKADQELAKEVALSVEGIEKVTNKLTVEDSPRSTPVGDTVANAEGEVRDAVLESRVKTALISELGLNAFDIEVEAADGTVSIRGALPSETTSELALKTVENCKGVDEVVNLLTIEKTS